MTVIGLVGHASAAIAPCTTPIAEHKPMALNKKRGIFIRITFTQFRGSAGIRLIASAGALEYATGKARPAIPPESRAGASACWASRRHGMAWEYREAYRNRKPRSASPA